MKKLILIIALFPASLWGQITAASCSSTDVQTAFNAITSSTTTVTIPAGNSGCHWSTQVTLTVPSGNTSLTITGAGSLSTVGGGDVTVVTDDYASNNSVFAIHTNSTASSVLKILGITFQGGTGLVKFGGIISVDGSEQFRFGYSHLNTSTYSPGNNSAGMRLGGCIYGVADHVILDQTAGGVNNGIQEEQGACFGDPNGFGDYSWHTATDLGSANAFYVETSQINNGAANDCLNGGRFVFRFNTWRTTTPAPAVQTHPTGSAGSFRGCRMWEIYNNTITAAPSNYISSLFFLSSGTGVFWGNTIPSSSAGGGTGYAQVINLNSMRTNNTTYPQNAPPAGWGYCGTTSGPSNWDQNLNGTGQHCIDQPGMGVGDLLQGGFTSDGSGSNNKCDVTTGQCSIPNYNGSWVNEAVEPVYEWADNFTPVPSNPSVLLSVNSGFVNTFTANADYYTWCNASSTTGCTTFNGTQGTGSGVLASRPSTCTPGVVYWATDQGSWNSSGGGGQGVAYKCGPSANTWGTFYTPYSYPHPLVSGGSGVSLTVSTNGTGSGAVSGAACTTGSYTSGFTIGPCTAAASGSSTFTGWTVTGSAACSGTINPCPSFSLTATTTVTATFEAQVATPTFSPTSLSSPGRVTITSSTSSSTCHYTVDGTTPTTSSTVVTHPLYVGQSQTLKAVCSAAGYTNSAVGSQAYAPAVAKTKFAISAIAASENTNPFPNPNRSIVVEWLNVLTSPATDCNTYNWAPLDAWTTQSAAKGVVNLYTFSHVPQCANGTTNNANPPTDLTTGDTFFKNFVTAFWEHECSLSSPPSTPLTAASCNNMKYVETWNEDNTDLYWTDTYAHKAIMDNDMAGITKTFCSDCIVILGSVSAGGSGSHANGQSGYYDVAMLTEATAWAALSPFNAPDAVSIHDYWSRSNISPPPFVTTIASNSDATCTTGNTPNSSCYVPVIQEFSRVQGSAVLQNSAISSWAANLPVFGTEGGYGHVSNLCASTPSLCVNGIAEHMVGVASQNASTHSVPIDLLYASNTCTSPNDWGCYWNNGTSPQLPAINQVVSWLGANMITGSLTSSVITGGNKWTLPLSGGEIDFCDAWLANCTTSTSFNTQQHLDGTVTTLSGTVTLTQEPTLLASATTYTLSTATAGAGSGTITGCAGSYIFGATYTCTVTPATGSTLTGVSGCGGSGTTTYAGTMPASNCTVTATFGIVTYTLTTTHTNGTVTGTNCAAGTYNYNTAIGACTATPNTGYSFTGWSGTGSCSGVSGTGTASCTLTANSTLTAAFTLNSYTVTFATAGSGSGSISGTNCTTASYTYGTAVSCTATPSGGSTFAGWSGLCSGIGSCSFSVSAAGTATATFNTSATPQVSISGSVKISGSAGVQ